MDWVRALNVGGVTCVPRFIRNTLASRSEENIHFLQGMYRITISGTVLDEGSKCLNSLFRAALIYALRF